MVGSAKANCEVMRGGDSGNEGGNWLMKRFALGFPENLRRIGLWELDRERLASITIPPPMRSVGATVID